MFIVLSVVQAALAGLKPSTLGWRDEGSTTVLLVAAGHVHCLLSDVKTFFYKSDLHIRRKQFVWYGFKFEFRQETSFFAISEKNAFLSTNVAALITY